LMVRLQNKFLSIEKVLKLLYGFIYGTLYGPTILPQHLNTKYLEFQKLNLELHPNSL